MDGWWLRSQNSVRPQRINRRLNRRSVDLFKSCLMEVRIEDAVLKERFDVTTELGGKRVSHLSSTRKTRCLAKRWVITPTRPRQKLPRKHVEVPTNRHNLAFLVKMAWGSRQVATRSDAEGAILHRLKFPHSRDASVGSEDGSGVIKLRNNQGLEGGNEDLLLLTPFVDLSPHPPKP